MRALSARDLLQVWERGEGQHPVDRALTLLVAACPERSWGELAGLSVGQRDTLLLALRGLTFGPQLNAFASCPQCGQDLEFTVNLDDLRAAAPTEPTREHVLEGEGWHIVYRLPDSRDLAAIAPCSDVETARGLLIHRCVRQAHRGETPIPPEELPESALAALGAHMMAADPLAEIQLELHCPACDQRWPTLLDIQSFFWAEIAAQAKRILGEIHALARAYGWREDDILAMSARRRQMYLELVI